MDTRNVLRLIFPALFFLLAFHVEAQSFFSSDQDTVKAKAISITEIPTRSAALKRNTARFLKELVSVENIRDMKEKSDSINTVVSTDIGSFKIDQQETRSLRYLENRKLQLTALKSTVEEASSEQTLILKDLDQKLKYLDKESVVWQLTKVEVEKSSYGKSLIDRIENLENLIDTARFAISQHAELLFSSLDRSSQITFDIDEQISLVDSNIDKIEKQVLGVDYPSLFHISFDLTHLGIRAEVENYYQTEILDLLRYLKANSNSGIFAVLAFLVLIPVFYRTQKKLPDGSISTYIIKLKIVLARPISSAIILGLFVTTLFYHNRPLVFRDMMGYLVTIPLMLILRDILHRRYVKYIYAIAAMMFLNIVFVILSPDHLIYRLTMLMVAIFEVLLTLMFMRITLKEDLENHRLQHTYRYAAYFFLLLELAGLYGAIAGNIMLAEVVLFGTYISLFAAALLYILDLIFIGGFMTLMDTKQAQKIQYIVNFKHKIITNIRRFINFLLALYWMIFVLNRLKVWDIVWINVQNFFNHDWSIGKVQFSLTMVLVFFLVIYISILISRMVQAILRDDVLYKMQLPKGMPHTISVLARYSIISLGFLLAVTAAGLQMSSLTVILGAFGVGIGFGLQNIFNNLVSGLILLFERPVQIGDTIEIGALIGTVKSIGIRSSNVRTVDGAEVIVPNGQLISSELINWTLSDQQRRIEVIVGVAYKEDPHLVKQLLAEVLDKHKEVIKDPEPVVLFNELGESSLDFRLLFWVTSFSDWLRIKSEIIFDSFDILKANGIEIPFPQRDLHVRSIEQSLEVKKQSEEE